MSERDKIEREMERAIKRTGTRKERQKGKELLFKLKETRKRLEKAENKEKAKP